MLRRNAATGKLTQGSGAAGCIAARAANGCARGFGLLVPNSVAVSADGRSVYATSVASNAIAIFRRNQSTGALTQAGNGDRMHLQYRHPRLHHGPRARRARRRRGEP